MSEDPAGAPRDEPEETPVDRFEHEIEDLERPWLGVKQVAIGVVIAVGLLGAFLLGGQLQQGNRDTSKSEITNIETQEPRRTQLADKPRVFRWESIARANGYLVRIQEEGSEVDLIFRLTPSNWLELTPEEQSRLVRGGRYQWSVRARGSDGFPIGEGKSTFGL